MLKINTKSKICILLAGYIARRLGLKLGLKLGLTLIVKPWPKALIPSKPKGSHTIDEP